MDNDRTASLSSSLGQLHRIDRESLHDSRYLVSNDATQVSHAWFDGEPNDQNYASDRRGPSINGPSTQESVPLSGFREATGGTPPSLSQLLRPSVTIQFDGLAESSQIGVEAYGLTAKMPLYPVFGPPPPFIELGYRQFRIDAPTHFDLPEVLHDATLGLSWIRLLNERWMLNIGTTAAFASDGNAVSSEAWQFRGNVFAIYRRSETLSFAFGALATGRSDLPVIPVAGAIWLPSDELRCDFRLPQARLARRLVVGEGGHSHWGYLGAGFWGGTWAFEDDARLDDRVTYRDWRVSLGWEWVRPQAGPAFIPPRKIFGAEIGYAFARQFEFDSFRDEITPEGTFLLQCSAAY